MKRKECPHCGDIVSREEMICTCGYTFQPEDELRGAKAARDVSEEIRDTGPRRASRGPNTLRGMPLDEVESRKRAAQKRTTRVSARIVDSDSGRGSGRRHREYPAGERHDQEHPSGEHRARERHDREHPSGERPTGERRARRRRSEERRGSSQSGDARLMPCPSCVAQISKRAEKCPKCGKAPFAECHICDAKIRVGTSVCPACGDPDPFNG